MFLTKLTKSLDSPSFIDSDADVGPPSPLVPLSMISITIGLSLDRKKFRFLYTGSSTSFGGISL